MANPKAHSVTVKKEDLMFAKIQEVSATGIELTAPERLAVSDIEFETSPDTVFRDGQDATVRVVRCSNTQAFVERVRGKYSRQDWPGDIVDTTALEPIKEGVCQGDTANSTLDKLIVLNTTPGQRVKAKLLKVSDSIGFAVPKQTLESGVAVGDELTVTTTVGSSDAEPKDTEFIVQLEEKAKITGRATVVVESISKDGIFGEVVSYEANLPSVGDTVQGNVTKGSRTVSGVTRNGASLKIELQTSAPVDGVIVAKIDATNDYRYEASLLDYPNKPIEVGVTLGARVFPSKQIAIPTAEKFDFEIQLKTKPSSYGRARVELVEVKDELVGETRGSIDSIDVGDQNKNDPGDVDITNLSKL